MDSVSQGQDAGIDNPNELIPLEKEMISDIENLDIPPEIKKKLIRKATTIVSISNSFSGPLPPPEMLAKYNQAVPNGAERILAMTEAQLKHRQKVEKKKFKQSAIGQIMGFALAVGCIAGTIYLSMNDHESVAIVLGTCTIIGLVTVFVLGKRAQSIRTTGKE